ncbi:MAG: short-chain dehydrogenase [Chitinophagaceae bacterium]|nr:short-chain dehydrogenase [Chitinophagaceae bacterium]
MQKRIVVSGGTKGIGKAIVELFAQKGYEVITCSRSIERLEALKADIEKRVYAAKIIIFKADLSVKKEAIDFGQFIVGLGGTIDVLVNNTGLFIPGQIQNEEDGVLEQMISTNLYSAYHLTRVLLPSFIVQNKGDIFTICSTASFVPYTNGGSYCISKFALYGMNKVLREEMKPYGIRVVSVLPGATLTSSWEGVDLPSERFMKPEDVAESIWSAHQLSKNTVVEEILLRPQLGDL